MSFKKGKDNYSVKNGPWNKGKKLKPLSDKHKDKISNSMEGKNKGKDNPMYGKIPWNKGMPMQIGRASCRERV